MKELWIIALLLIFCAGQPAFAGEIGGKLLYDYGSKDGQVTAEKVSLSIGYDSDKYWIDEEASRDISQDVNFENFLGAGWKNKISARWDSSFGIIWEYDGKDSDYLGSLRVRYKGDNIKITGFYQPYIAQDGYIAKGSIINANFVQEFEYRSNGNMITLSTGFEF